MKRNPDLDGIRGIAIIMVLLFHLSPQSAIDKLSQYPCIQNIFAVVVYPISSLGWMGVDLFFVLSGFLITSILLEAKGHSNYFVNFYARRTLRIFPIYYSLLIVLLVIIPTLYPCLPLIPNSAAPFWVYIQNWWEANRTNSGFSSGFLGHTWSLAIEEQFYLIWPLIVYWFSSRTLIAVSLSLIIFCVVLRCVIVHSVGGADFETYNIIHFNTIMRCDALFLGALLACIKHSTPEFFLASKKTLTYIFFLSIALLFAILFQGPRDPQINNSYFQMIGYTLVSVIFFCVLAFVSTQNSPAFISVLLRSKHLCYIGTISYGLYLYHWPIYSMTIFFLRHDFFAQYGKMSLLLFPIIALPLSFIFASLSYHFIEVKILSYKHKFC